MIKKPIFLVINADDYGYFECVSRGIVACARKGAITATAVMANGPNFKNLAKWLLDIPDIDFGVHLNITYGQPISKKLRQKLLSMGGLFKTKVATAAMLLKKISASDVKAEWRSQIDTSLEAGLEIKFLNSHEHIHLFPTISRIIHEIAKEYGINHIRDTRPDWGVRPLTISALLRNILVGGALWSSKRHLTGTEPRLIGFGVSGKITYEYLSRCFGSLRPGKSYELMCHPGFFESEEILDKCLINYHDWNQEMELLMSESVKELIQRHHILLRRFSEL